MRSAVLLFLLCFCWNPAFGDEDREKRILNLTASKWLSFKTLEDQQLIFFSHLEAWRCGIRSVAFSINSEALDQSWAVPPCDETSSFRLSTEQEPLARPAGSVNSVAVQLTFTDGSLSETRTFVPGAPPTIQW